VTDTKHDRLLDDMRDLSKAIDEAVGTAEYTARCVALALLARQYLRDISGLEPLHHPADATRFSRAKIAPKV